MAPRKEVHSLRYISLHSFEKSITAIAVNMFETKNMSSSDNPYVLETLQIFLCNTLPIGLHDSIAEHLLRGLKKFSDTYFKPDSSESESSSKCHAVVENIASIITHLRVKKLDFEFWVEPIQSVLALLLNKMTSLELLICSSYSLVKDFRLCEQDLLDSCSCFLNLTSFVYHKHCSDNIVKRISDNCKSIRDIQVCSSENVTDNCIEHLINCCELQSVGLFHTSVTEKGCTKLLMESKSKKLMDIAGFKIHNDNLLCRNDIFLTPFQLRKLQFDDCNSEEVSLACRFFPYLIDIIFSIGDGDSFDFSSLLNIDKLQKLVFRYRGDSILNDSFDHFVSVKGFSITSLSLFFDYGITMKIISVIAVFCPNIEDLVLISPTYHDDDDRSIDFSQMDKHLKPLQKLTSFESFSKVPGLKFILQHAHNIEFLFLWHCEQINDEFLKDVLRVNPLKNLRSLVINNETNDISYEMAR